ncbi:PAS domain-containing sensor histidine kinase [Polaribacter sejongensis]|uniref:histidine kinase n=1 Tax=Polaribacter sejongensis TaxID=985043 RepID=A0AAJ1QUR3_9FLAO|nr:MULTISPECIES: PAS domain-containing sensor histidine kinase [Polaribacter]AUC21666.1 PAS domain-containing sensor histidine kinase [Polaribacter sejongensis]MDN3618290.1 PAS domain-containing sensor histidine kinase [Polaribacter undariae]UWD30722.1 PAS domain-containing sensor histidine kinase [Polaribacter undariae]
MLSKDRDVFNVLFEAVSEGVVVVNDKQNIVSVNSSVERMFGYDPGELINKPLNILIPKNYHAGHGAHFKGFMKNKEKRQMGNGRDLYGARKNGAIFPLEAGLNPFQIEGQTFIMALIIDISVRKQQEEEIHQLNNDLEKKVCERTKELSKTVHELKTVNIELDKENHKRLEAENKIKDALKKQKELNELKTKFLSLVSHEFKTPLSGILTSTMLLGKYKLAEQQEKRDKHLETITNKVHYLNNILNDFLSIEILETGKVNYKFHSFKLSKVVDEVIYNANMLLKVGQRIKYPEDIDDISLLQDEKTIALALSNLINNAIKYSPENSEIDIKIKQDSTTTTIKIKDQGIGIPKADQKNIFNRYFRAENALLTEGTGIGLNIIKSHLQNLGGTITFESEENIGSTFTLKIINKAI